MRCKACADGETKNSYLQPRPPPPAPRRWWPGMVLVCTVAVASALPVLRRGGGGGLARKEAFRTRERRQISKLAGNDHKDNAAFRWLPVLCMCVCGQGGVSVSFGRCRNMKYSSLGDESNQESNRKHEAKRHTKDHTHPTPGTHRIVCPASDAASPCCFCAGAWLAIAAALLCLAPSSASSHFFYASSSPHATAFHTIHRSYTTTKHHAPTRPPPRLPAPAPRLLPVADGASPGTFLAKVEGGGWRGSSSSVVVTSPGHYPIQRTHNR